MSSPQAPSMPPPPPPPGAIKIKFKRKRDESEDQVHTTGNFTQNNNNNNNTTNNNSSVVTMRRMPSKDNREEQDDGMLPPQYFGGGDGVEVHPAKRVRICQFPPVFSQRVVRAHHTVSSIVAADHDRDDDRSRLSLPLLENISHGQFQVLSTTAPEDVYKFEPVGLLEFKGVTKSLSCHVEKQAENSLHTFPMHADWFSFNSVHKMETQVFPEYFCGKSSELSPNNYMEARNLIVKKYLENPEKVLSPSDIQGLVNADAKQVARIFEFLDRWGIINYCAANDSNALLNMKDLLQEKSNGDLLLSPGSLRSIESLIRFEVPRSRLNTVDVSISSGCTSSAISDLDLQIQERLSEHRCAFCSGYCSDIFYQSQKETDVLLCSKCFNDGKPVIGTATVDFVRIDSTKDSGDVDCSNWTDYETLRLLDALRKFGDNWNEIAEFVGSKSKAQCMLHFIRMPVEKALLDSIDISDTYNLLHTMDEASETENESNSSGKSNACSGDSQSENRMVFANSGNPVMALIAFLASAVGPRVAAACAHEALVVLSNEGSNANRLNMENSSAEDGIREGASNFLEIRDQKMETQRVHANNHVPNALTPLTYDKVMSATMAGLTAAAVKAKQFAEQEEHEIQRLVASIVTNQLKRLDIKLKQFGEIEALLMKECEQVERSRQKLLADRSRYISSRMSTAGMGPLPVTQSTLSNRPVMSGTMPTTTLPGYGPTPHPAMAYMSRPSVYSYGPPGVGSSITLSALQPFSSGGPGSVLIGSTTASNSPIVQNMLRPVGGSNPSTS